MATRINTKFLLILAIVVCAAVGMIGGLWVLQIRGDTGRHIRKGDAMMAEARALEAASDDAAAAVLFEKAVNEYGRAVNKEPANLAHLAKVEEALLSMRPMTQSQANEFDTMRIGVLRREVRYQPRVADVHLDLIEELFRIARWLDQPDYWQEVADAAEGMYDNLPAGEPKRVYGRLYRGLAHMQLYGYGGAAIPPRTATQQEIDSAMADLKAFVQAMPEVDLGQAALIDSQLSLARQLKSEGSQRAADAMFAELDETMAAALEAVPDGPEVARMVALRLTLEHLAGDRPAGDPELVAAVNRMVELVSTSDDPLLLADAGRLLRIADQTGGLDRAIELMETYVDENPEAHFQRWQLARLYYDGGDLEEAKAQCRAIIDARPVKVSLLSRLQHILRMQASGMIVDCEYRAWDGTDEQDKPAQLAKVEDARDALAALVAEPDKEPLLLKADGKIAAAHQDHATAAARFERILQLVPSPDFDVLVYAARSLEQIDQLGLARERLVRAAGLQPQNPVVLIDKARLEYKIGLYNEAQRTAEAVLALTPGNTDATRLIAAIDTNRTGLGGEAKTPMARTLLSAGQAIAEGDLDGGREILLGALENTSDRLPVLTELVQLELRAGQSERAQDYLRQALELQPDNTYLRKLQVGLNSDDQINALKQYMADVYPDEGDRVVNTLIHLEALATELDRLVARQEANGDAAAAERARGRAEEARQEAAAMLARAEEIAPGHGALLEYLFNEALREENLDRLEELVMRAREHDSDLAGGLIFAGRYALVRKNYEEAIQTLAEATERKHYSSVAWRFLGRAYERTGNFADAMRAYEQSYACNPNDRIAIRWYVNLLMQTGDRERALRVLRAARHTNPNDTLLQEVRLELEAEIGDVGGAMQERRRYYSVRPSDRLNAMRLAVLLVKTTPTFEHLRDAGGNPLYKSDDWQLMAEKERREILDRTAAEWIAESEAILAALETQGEDEVELAVLRADLLKSRGLIDDGADALRAYRDRHPDDVQAHLALARYQSESGHPEDAIATLEAARGYQAEEKREADDALADLYFEQSMWERAAALYEGVVAVRPDPGVRLRLVECFTKLQRYDEADTLLSRVVDDSGPDFFTAMLRAAIAEGQADALLAAGLPDRAELKDLEVVEALDEAERRAPANPLPHVRRAQRLLKQYQRTEQLTLLDDALQSLDRADRVRAGSEATSRVRVEILRAKGDNRGAIGELTRLVRRAPDNIAARRLLIQLLVEAGNYGGALQVVNAAIEHNPSLGMWHDALGELYVQRSLAASGESAARAEAEEAAKAFREAYRLQPTASRLAKYAELALAAEDPDFRGVTSLIEASDDMLQGSPLLRGLYAAALTGEGRNSEAIEQMRLAWGEHQEILEMQPSDRRGILSWYRMLQVVMTDRDPAEYEQLVREVADGEPSPLALVWAARTWAVAPDQAGLTHAIELLDTAEKQCSPSDKELLGLIGLDRGQYHVSLNQYREAATAFETVIELAASDPDVPDHALALNNAAYLYAEHLGDPAQAVAYAQRAAAVNPNDPSILDTLGWALCKLDRNAEAEDALRRSIAGGPSPDNHLHMAWVFYQTGRPDQARTYLLKAEALRPSPGTQRRIDELGAQLRR